VVPTAGAAGGGRALGFGAGLLRAGGPLGERGWAARANGLAGACASNAAGALDLGEGYATWAESGRGMGGERPPGLAPARAGLGRGRGGGWAG
jgi:hypothetical protein